MTGYYVDRLSAERLRTVYEIAPPRVQQYLDAEVEHVASRIRAGDRVLELGCGYGRVMTKLGDNAGMLVGVDTSLSSLRLGQTFLSGLSDARLVQMDAVALGFRDAVFDVVVCIQNGLSAFKVDQAALVREGLRVLRPGGRALVSSYSEKFWEDRLEWFKLQAEAGLVGEIDRSRTRNGTIACKDGFTATTSTRDAFRSLAAQVNVHPLISEVDESSILCEMMV